MNLKDIITPEEFNEWHDKARESNQELPADKAEFSANPEDILPLLGCFRRCLKLCGSLTNNDETELAVTYATLRSLDSAIRWNHARRKPA